MTIRSINPATGETFAEYDYEDTETVDRKLSAARQTFEHWKRTGFDHRAELMHRAAELLDDNTVEYAELMVREMGKPIGQARGEAQKCAWACRYFADHAAEFLAPEQISSDASQSFVRHDPLGPIFAVMPWNFPLWQVIRFAAPNLMAGNVGVLKHSHNVGGCAVALQDLFDQAGFPEGAFQSIFIPTDQSDHVISHDAIRGVTLTGSVGAGRAVGRLASGQLKPTVLELGGSDPFIVFDDCDLDRAVEQAVHGRTINNGQSCIAAKRFVVEAGVHDEFVDRFRRALADLTVGDPADEATDLGPLARQDLREVLDDQVTRSTDAGARCLVGGQIPPGDGYYYPATLLVDCAPGVAAFDEETFGPVAAVACARDVDHAIDLANDTDFGLGASIWTDKHRGIDLAEHIQAGHVAVNGIVKSDPRLPFGGIKHSGYGRELGRRGIREFVNKKTVWAN